MLVNQNYIAIQQHIARIPGYAILRYASFLDNLEECIFKTKQGQYMSKIPLLILTSDAGFGHRSAAYAIQAALEELYGNLVDAIVFNPTAAENTPDLLLDIEQGYDEIVVENPELYRLSYNALHAPLVSRFVREVVGRMYHKTMRELIEKVDPKVIVSTYPLHADSASVVLKEMNYACPITVVVTDLVDVQSLWYSQAATMHYVPTTSIQDQAIENNINPAKITVTGLPVNTEIKKEQRATAEIRSALGWKEDLYTCLVVASPRTKEMASISSLLSNIPDLQIAVICGGNSELHSQLIDIADLDNFFLYDWVENIPQLMKGSDIIISKAGGLVISEALACGRPLILSEALPGQEIGNMHYVVDNNAGAWAPGPLEVLATVVSFIKDDGKKLKEYQENAKALGKPEAAFDIAKSIWALCECG